jgi:hypothetical protein
MTKDAWRDSATTDVLFPDDLEEKGPISVVGPPLEADEIDTNTVTYGTVAELDGDHHDADYVVCPKALRSAIADAWGVYADDCAVLKVVAAEKDGHEDDAPWVIEAETLEMGDPL